MKFEFKILLIAAILILTSFILSDNRLIHAQSGNTIGQEGDGNEVSQSIESIQSSNQNSLCVSGESTSLSCNNLSGQRNGLGQRGEEGTQGPSGPQSISGSTYYASTVADDTPGSDGSFSADSVCQAGDTVISGRSLYVTGPGISADAQPLGSYLSGPIGEQTWRTFATPHSVKDFQVQSTAFCFDNP